MISIEVTGGALGCTHGRWRSASLLGHFCRQGVGTGSSCSIHTNSHLSPETRRNGGTDCSFLQGDQWPFWWQAEKILKEPFTWFSEYFSIIELLKLVGWSASCSQSCLLIAHVALRGIIGSLCVMWDINQAPALEKETTFISKDNEW